MHHLVMGGDVLLGRRLNVALADPTKRPRIFGSITPRLQAADLALANAEGVIALGGTFADKGEPRPHQHHALPEAADVLRDAGIDVVTFGNNHAGDYGPSALLEARDRLSRVGIDVAGGGQDLAEASSPVYRRVGDVVVAIVGADLTMAGKHAATATRPGIFHLAGMDPRSERGVVQALLGIEAEARQHAHVVILSPHWGENFVTAPTDLTRSIAHALLDGGYDAILGHSAHVMQGVEVYRGKPIAYDAGDLVMDYDGRDEAHQAVLYDLAFTRAGAVALDAYPIFLEPNQTAPADAAMSAAILDRLVARSRALATVVTVSGGVAHVDCQPGAIHGPDEAVDPPRSATPATVRLAPSETVVDAVPATAKRVDVSWADLGLHLLGTELLLSELHVPKSGNVVRLYFRADRPLPANLLVRVGTTDSSPDPLDDHVPGDWMLPSDRWPTGAIIQDRFLTRMLGDPEGVVTYSVGIVEGGRVVPGTPTSVDGAPLPAVRDGLVEIGSATWSTTAAGLFEVFGADPRSALAGAVPAAALARTPE